MIPLALFLSVLCKVTIAQDDNLEKLVQRVPGVPGQDYPIFSIAPETSFLCEVQPAEGYYADQEADCQLYHVCSDIGDGVFSKFDFLCPNGTVFNQEEFVCDWWFNVDCSNADAFYYLNIEIAEKNAERQRLRELERENEAEEENRGGRSELSSDQINDLRNGNRQEKSQKEEPRRPNTISKQSSRPFSSNSKTSNPFASKSPTTKPFGGNKFQSNKSFGGNSFGGNNRQATNSFGESNRQTGNTFGGANRQSSNSFGGRNRQTGNAIGGTNRKTPVNNRQTSANQTTRKNSPKAKNLGSNPRQVAKTSSRNRNSRKQSTKGNLRKTTKKSKVKAFTNFGNGQSRFGNF